MKNSISSISYDSNRGNGISRHREFAIIGLILILWTLAALDVEVHELNAVKIRYVVLHLGVPYANFPTGGSDRLDVELIGLFAKQNGVRYAYVRRDWGNIIWNLTGKRVRIDGNEV